jgi:tripartite-type tricarboxylate transporter receptor subunit TctC
MTFHRRDVLLGLAGLAAGATAARADFPSRPVDLVVPFTAGGGSDLLARLLSEGLAARLGRPCVVVNRPGANTNVGTFSVVRAKPDGATLLIASVGLAANPSLYPKLGLDPLKQLAPISLLANAPTLLVVPPRLPVGSLTDFIAYAKAHPDGLNFGSYGAGSGPHLATELFMAMTGTRLMHIAYGGGGPAALAAMSNQVQALFSSVLPVLGMVRDGSLKALAIAADRRSPLLPGVPTFKENGLDYRTGTWFGLLAPAATPPDIIATLNRTTVAVLRDARARERLEAQGAEVVAGSPDEFRTFIRIETDRLSRVIRAANIRLD